jgi:hypothetical protein
LQHVTGVVVTPTTQRIFGSNSPFNSPKLGIFQLQLGSWSLYHNTQIAAKTINQNQYDNLPPETQTLKPPNPKPFMKQNLPP